MELCLFSPDGRHETDRLALRDREGGVWHGRVEGVKPGQRYGYRAHGPYAPEAGHRFNANKLLLDPYARQIDGVLHTSDAIMGYQVGSTYGDLSFDSRDSAFAVPKSVVVGAPEGALSAPRPAHAWEDSIFYEAHVKGMTAALPGVPEALRGRFSGLASDPVLEHLTRLGITAIELLPVQAFVDERFLAKKGLKNYWGYQTVGFLAPEPRYLSEGQIWDFRAMVERFHLAGIEVILDVVYNHSGEGDEFGPTLCFRGLDNRSYYRLIGEGRHYVNDTGTGNTLNLRHPMVLRLVLDSLRYWVEVMGVDGFRFDLAATLAREGHGFDADAALLSAIRQDPVLSRIKLIAEPWDIGPGGYRLGQFPAPFREWNDRFRDGVRRFWRGEALMTADLAERVLGSAAVFDHQGRAATSSVNFVTAHDGFTLEDLVSYRHKHNEANGEANRDGHHENHSDNFGVEGSSEDAAITAARKARKRALLATLMVAQGTPMLLGGDEIGRTQDGNNNAYAIDSTVTWLDWQGGDAELCDFVVRLVALRKAHPVLSQARFLHGRRRPADGRRDIIWRKPSGHEPMTADWHDPSWRTLCAEIRASAEGDDLPGAEVVFVVFNAGSACEVTLPEGGWRLILDSADPKRHTADVAGRVPSAANAVQIYAAHAGAAAEQGKAV